MKARVFPFVYMTAGVIAGAAIVASLGFVPQKGIEITESGKSPYKWVLPESPKSLSFAGEKVPLDRWEVKEQMDREMLVNCYGHSNTMYIIRLHTRFFPVIEERLRANGVPDDFKYLCVAESSLQNQTSRAGAVGYWQFLKETGTRYGLEINDDVDERYNMAKATDAACKYFKEAYEKFGSWTAAAASYNCGMGGFNNFSSYQSADNYYDLQLPEETMRYVFRILAFKVILSNPEKAGFAISKAETYKPFRTKDVTVDSSVSNLADFAMENGTSYRMIKLYNPWLRSRKLTVRPGKSYTVAVPE